MQPPTGPGLWAKWGFDFSRWPSCCQSPPVVPNQLYAARERKMQPLPDGEEMDRLRGPDRRTRYPMSEAIRSYGQRIEEGFELLDEEHKEDESTPGRVF